MIEVPLKYGWFNYDESDTKLDWFDNDENYTFEQCKFISDCVSSETKFVKIAKTDEEFKLEQEALRQNMFPI